MSLIRDEAKTSKERPVLVESFADVFGSKATRKRVTLKNFSTLDDLAENAQESIGAFNEKTATHLDGEAGDLEAAADPLSDEEPVSLATREPVFSKGQSRRIWNELYRYGWPLSHVRPARLTTILLKARSTART